MCACMNADVNIGCMQGNMYVGSHEWMSMHIFAYINTGFMHAWMYVCIYVVARHPEVYECIFACMHIYIYIHTFICMQVSMHTQKQILPKSKLYKTIFWVSQSYQLDELLSPRRHEHTCRGFPVCPLQDNLPSDPTVLTQCAGTSQYNIYKSIFQVNLSN